MTDLNFYEKYIILLNTLKIVENVFLFLVLSLTEQCYLYFDQFDSGEMEAGKDAAPSSSRPPSAKPSSRPTSAKPGIYTYQINTMLYKHIMTCF